MNVNPSTIYRKQRRFPYFRVMIVFLVTFSISATVAAAAAGFDLVTAQNNHIVVVDDREGSIGGGDQEMRISVSDSMWGSFNETVKAPIDVVVHANEMDYTRAGQIYVKNETKASGKVRRRCEFLGGEYINRAIALKVTGSSSSDVIYEGDLKEYCINTNGKGNFHLDPEEIKEMVFYVRYRDLDDFVGIKKVNDNPNGFPEDQINFDLSFSPV